MGIPTMGIIDMGATVTAKPRNRRDDRAVLADSKATTLAVEDCSSCAAAPAPRDFRRFYRPELDVVRFIAFFLVFRHHSLPIGLDSRTAALPHGLAQGVITVGLSSSFGLSLFFTLSAYLICELLLREREATGVVQAKQFYIRRILRIWPLYFAGLAIGLAFALISGGNPDALPWAAWSAIMLGNWFVGSGSAGGGPMDDTCQGSMRARHDFPPGIPFLSIL
jgi:hypothetical protein